MADEFGIPDFSTSLSLPSFGIPGTRSRRRRAPKPRKQDEAVDQKSIARKVGDLGLSGLAAVGNVLDTPHSMARDLLAGQNPFDQLLAPWSGENRIGGRDLLRKYGLVGKKDTWANFAAGLGVELTGPGLLGGARVLGKTATGLKAAKTGTAVKGLGNSIRAGERALYGGKIPFGPHWQIGTGAKSAAVGDALDKALELARYKNPVGLKYGSLFDPESAGRTTEAGQRAAKDAYSKKADFDIVNKGTQLNSARRMKETGTADRRVSRMGFEGVGGKLDRAILNPVRRHLREERQVRQALGMPSYKYKGRGKYHPRFSDETLQYSGDTARAFGALSAKDAAREELFNGFKHVTEGVNDLYTDKNVRAIYDAVHTGGMVRDAGEKALRKYIRGSYRKLIKPTYTVINESGKTIKKSRYKGLANHILDQQPGVLEKGLYPNNPVNDFQAHARSSAHHTINVDSLLNRLTGYADPALKSLSTGKLPTKKAFGDTFEYIPEPHGPFPVGAKLPTRSPSPAAKAESMSIKDLLQTVGLHEPGTRKTQHGPAIAILQKLGAPITGNNVDALLNSRVPLKEAKDLAGLLPQYKIPAAESSLVKGYDALTNLTKAGLLTHPARHVRDFSSAQVANNLEGIANPWNTFEAQKLYSGDSIQNLQNIPEIQKWVSDAGLPLDDDSATQAARFLFAQQRPSRAFQHSDGPASVPAGSHATIEGILGDVPGYNPSTLAGNTKDVLQTLAGKTPDASWSKPTIRGVMGAEKTTLPPVRASEKISEGVDTMNRMPAFINLMRKGYSAKEAAKRVDETQVSYDPKTFTQFEKQVLKRLFPFYSFTSRQGKHVAKELLTNPHGGLGTAIRAQNSGRDKDSVLPDFIQDTAAIPLGENPDGSKRFVTGLGLMHEDPLQFAAPSVQGGLMEILGRMNPLLTLPMETATGQSFFQKSGEGGRPLSELDPTIGRLLANVTGQEDPVEFPGSRALDQILGKSPVSRLLTSARQLTDTRKGALEKTLNLGTGVRITDVSPQSQEAALERALKREVKALGGKTYSNVYFPEDKLLRQSAGVRGQVKEYQEALKQLGALKRARKKKTTGAKK